MTAPNEKRQSVSRTLPMVSSQCVSRYRDLFTTETKELLFTTETKELSCYVATFPLVLFAWPMIQSGYEMKDSNFFRCALRAVLKWCKVREHEKTTSVSTIDFPPTLTYESTSAN